MKREGLERWVDGLRGGDPAALDAVFTALRPRLFSYLCRLGARREVAEDLVQEAFLRLAEKAPTLRPDTRVDAWMFAVGRNLLVSWWRRHGRGIEVLTDVVIDHPDSLSPFEHALASETERRLERAVASLPPGLRDPLLLVAVEGFEPQEAAAICGLRPDALRQRLHRAREILARALSRGKEAT